MPRLPALARRVLTGTRPLAAAALLAAGGAAAEPVAVRVASDADCRLQVGTRPPVALSARQPLTLQLAPGAWTLRCTGTQAPQAVAEQRLALSAGAPAEVRLRVRWAEQADGLLDRRQGLLWQRHDNGQDVDWAGAQQACREAGAGWRLPSRAELEGLYASGVPGETVPCREAACKLPALFTLSSYWLWSGDGDEREAWYLYLHTGHPNRSPVGYALHARALCVRAAG